MTNDTKETLATVVRLIATAQSEDAAVEYLDTFLEQLGKVKEPTMSSTAPRKHNHYFKPCPYKEIDVYRVLLMFGVTDPCLQHSVKKLLVAGGRGAGKPIDRDVREAIDTLERWCEMRAEEPAVQA